MQKGKTVSVFKYTVIIPQREDAIEHGTVIASSEKEAIQKLHNLELNNPKLTRITGIPGLLKRFSADVK